MRRVILSLLLIFTAYSQEETILTRARALFNADHSVQALAILNEHLTANPGDSDARVLLGLICSWTKRYDEGRKAFRLVLDSDPDYKDAVLGLINLEFWAGNPASAVEVAKQGLALRPQDSDYRAALSKVLAVPEAPAKAHPPEKPVSEGSWETGVAQSNIWFSDQRATWHEVSATLARNTNAGWVTARFSHASWGGVESNLIELESYPRIRPGTYGFLEGAFSPDGSLYAHRRFGAEIFQNLPSSFEASAGIRYMRFNGNTVLYTGSVARYFGNWWIMGRTFVSPDSITGISKSLQVSARRYFRDADHYLGLRAGVGASPFEIRSVNDINVQKSTSGAFEALWRFRNGVRFRATVGAAKQTRFGALPLWQFQTDGTFYYSF